MSSIDAAAEQGTPHVEEFVLRMQRQNTAAAVAERITTGGRSAGLPPPGHADDGENPPADAGVEADRPDAGVDVDPPAAEQGVAMPPQAAAVGTQREYVYNRVADDPGGDIEAFVKAQYVDFVVRSTVRKFNGFNCIYVTCHGHSTSVGGACSCTLHERWVRASAAEVVKVAPLADIAQLTHSGGAAFRVYSYGECGEHDSKQNLKHRRLSNAKKIAEGGATVARSLRKLLHRDSEEKAEYVPAPENCWRIKGSQKRAGKAAAGEILYNTELEEALRAYARTPQTASCDVWIDMDLVNLEGMIVVPFMTDVHKKEFEAFVVRRGWDLFFYSFILLFSYSFILLFSYSLILLFF
jgi:hypothetical protein